MFEFKLPDLGEGIHEGELLKWHVKEGDIVQEDDPLCDMETDKATVTIPSPRTGTIVKLNGRPGDTIPVGHVLVKIEEEPAGQPEDDTGSKPLQSHPDSDTVEKQSGESKQADESKQIADAEEISEDISTSRKKVAAAPATRRLAREMGIDITTITGTGAAGKVTPEDVRAAAGKTENRDNKDERTEEPVSGTRSGFGLKPEIPFFEIAELPDYAAQGPVEKIPIRSLRKKVAVKTTSSMILIPHVAHMDEWDVTEIEALRKELNSREQQSGKLTLLSFIIRGVASLLRQYPEFNASVDTTNMEIVHKKFYHIGFAADTPKGLMVPVIDHADQKNVTQIAQAVRDLAEKGKDGTIQANELSGSTFTITNVGAIGGTGVLPIINTPESAILGMGRVTAKPIAKADAVVIRKMLPVTLCFDHRVADGAGAARFMRDLKQMIEDPMVFLTRI